MTPEQIAAAIVNEAKIIKGKLADFGRLSREAAETEAEYKVQSATARGLARLEAAAKGEKITAAEIEDLATLDCAESLREMLLAQGDLSAAREALRGSQARLDALRTLSAGNRA